MFKKRYTFVIVLTVCCLGPFPTDRKDTGLRTLFIYDKGSGNGQNLKTLRTTKKKKKKLKPPNSN